MSKKVSDAETNKDTKRKGSVSKHKYEVHYHEWQREELDNLLETISNVAKPAPVTSDPEPPLELPRGDH